MARPHIEPYVELNDAYKKWDLPGVPLGSQYKVLSIDRDNGACSLKVQFDAGYRRKPGMSYSDSELFILDGRVKIGDTVYGRGHYYFIPAGVHQDSMHSDDGFEALVFYNDGLPSFIESDESHQLAMHDAFVSINAYMDAPWLGVARRNPGVASGFSVKSLRMDPLTKANTFLYAAVPEFIQDNISYHDCAEEAYHIHGDCFIMQFGELPTGGYFWRPPYINHGCFSSRQGCIALARIDSELVNYFHFNPWTNPDENLQRAAAQLYNEKKNLWDWTVVHGHNHPHGPDAFDHPHDHSKE
jgi:hypothetical protein